MNFTKYRFKQHPVVAWLLHITALLLLTVSIASAHQFSIGGIDIDHPWAMPLPPVSPNGAVYLVISNNGDTADRLLGGASPVADKVEIHTHVHKDGQMQMQQLADGLEITAGEVAEFAPGLLHLMLIGLNKPLVEGENFPLTLEFEQAGSIDLMVNIEQDGANNSQITPDSQTQGEHAGHSTD